MHLDLLTLDTLDIIQPLLIGAVLLLALRGGNKPLRLEVSLKLWVLALLSLALGFVVHDLRDIIGNAAATVAMDALFLGASVFACHALRLLCGTRLFRRQVMLLALLAWLGACALTLYWPLPQARLVVMTAASAALLAHAAWPMLGAFRAHGEPAQRVMVAMIATIIAGHLWQVAVALTHHAPLWTNDDVSHFIGLLIGAFSPILSSVGFLLLYHRANQHAMESLARIDAATGVHNSDALFHEGERLFASAFRHGRSLSLLHVDVDHFRRINDIAGQRGGDRLLRAIATTLQRTLRTEDLLTRLHGKEFVALLPDTVLSGARESAERLREAIAATRESIDGRPMAATISVGVTDLQPGDRNLDMLLERSARALRSAKRAGCNRVVVHSPDTVDDPEGDPREARSRE